MDGFKGIFLEKQNHYHENFNFSNLILQLLIFILNLENFLIIGDQNL